MLSWLIVLIVIVAEALLKLDEILINFLALLNKHLMRHKGLGNLAKFTDRKILELV